MKESRERARTQRGDSSDRETPPRTTTAAPEGPVLAARGLALDGMGNRALLALLRSGRLQRKARLSQPDDPREHAADRAADAVVADGPAEHPAHDTGSGGGRIAPMPAPAASDAQGARITGGLSGGSRLDEQTRGLMESRFGESFEQVRIHTGHRAGEQAGSLQSRAFTIGEDIVFGEGQYAPETTEGRRLLAHELAHVVQQRRTVGAIAGEKDTERDAREAAREVMGGGTPAVRERAAAGTVQREPKAQAKLFKTVPTSISGEFTVPKTSWYVYAEGSNGAPVATVLTVRSDDPVSASAYELPSEPGVLYVDISAPAAGSEIHLRTSAGRWHSIRNFRSPAPLPKPAPKPKPKPPQPKPKQPQPQPQPPQPDEPQHEPPTPTEPAGQDKARPDASPTGRVRSALDQDAGLAAQVAANLNNEDMETLPTEERRRLLQALADNLGNDELDIETVERLLDTTPDADASDLYDRLLKDPKLLAALQSHASGDAAFRLEAALLRLQQRAKFVTPQEGFVRRLIGPDGRPHYMNDAQLAKATAELPKQLERAFKDIDERADMGKQTQKSVLGNYQLDVESWSDIAERPAALIGIFSDIWGDTHAPSSRVWDEPKHLTKLGREALKNGDNREAARYFQRAGEEIARIEREWKTYTGKTIEGGEKLQEDIKIAATTAIVVASAGYAAPAVYGSSLTLLGGEGITAATAGFGLKAGATALTATTLGFYGGLGGGAVYSGFDSKFVGGQGVSSEGFWKGAKAGAPAGFTAGLGYGLGNIAGLGPNMPRTALNFGKAALVHGTTNAAGGMLGATLDGKGAGDIASAGGRDFLFGSISGVAGAGMQPWLQKSPWLNRGFQTVIGGAIPAGGTLLTGGSAQDAWKAALIGSTSSFAISLAPHPPDWKPPKKTGAPAAPLLGQGEPPHITPPSRQLPPAPETAHAGGTPNPWEFRPLGQAPGGANRFIARHASGQFFEVTINPETGTGHATHVATGKTVFFENGQMVPGPAGLLPAAPKAAGLLSAAAPEAAGPLPAAAPRAAGPMLLGQGEPPHVTPPSHRLPPAPADRLPALLGNDYAKFHADAVALKASNPELAHLSIPELIAIRAYTSPQHYTPMNNQLRYPSPAGEKYRPLIDFAAIGVEKLPGYSGPLSRREAGHPGDVATRWPQGGVHEEAGFFSTTEGKNTFSRQLGGMVYISIESPIGQGRRVAGVSVSPRENEILFGPGARFRVKNVVPAGQAALIQAEELPRSLYSPSDTRAPWVVADPTPSAGGPVHVPRGIPGIKGPPGPGQFVIPRMGLEMGSPGSGASGMPAQLSGSRPLPLLAAGPKPAVGGPPQAGMPGGAAPPPLNGRRGPLLLGQGEPPHITPPHLRLPPGPVDSGPLPWPPGAGAIDLPAGTVELVLEVEPGLNPNDVRRKAEALNDICSRREVTKIKSPTRVKVRGGAGEAYRGEPVAVPGEYKFRLLDIAHERFGPTSPNYDPVRWRKFFDLWVSKSGDHVQDLQLSGADDIGNIWLFDAETNSALGRQIELQLRRLPYGTRISGVKWRLKPP